MLKVIIMSCGFIYQIINVSNNNSYIGYTKNFYLRMWRHHKSQYSGKTTLYDAFRKYGIENFVVRILEQPLIQDLSEREKYWIKFFDTHKHGYNMTEGGDGGTTTKGRKPHNYIEVNEQKIFKLRQQNYSVKDIAKIVECTECVVWRVLGTGNKQITKKDRIDKVNLKLDLLNKQITIKHIRSKYDLSCSLLTKLTLEIFDNDKEFIKQNIHRKPRI